MGQKKEKSISRSYNTFFRIFVAIDKIIPTPDLNEQPGRILRYFVLLRFAFFYDVIVSKYIVI